MRLRLLAMIGAVVSALAGCGPLPALSFGRGLPGPNGEGTFLISTGGYQDTTLVLLDARTGRVVDRDVASGRAFLSGVEGLDGSVLLAKSTSRCPTDLYRIGPGRTPARLLRRVPIYVSSLAVSPDGRRLAFVTYDSCTVPPPGAGATLAGRLAILNLQTGQITKTPSSAPFAADPAWSPDGRDVIVDGGFHLTILPADDLGRREAVPGPADCTESAATWTRTGIWAVAGCGPNRAAQSNPSEFLHLRTDGSIVGAWPLPACAVSASTLPVRGRSEAIGMVEIGGNSGPCGAVQPTRIVRLQAGLPTIASIPDVSGIPPASSAK